MRVVSLNPCSDAVLAEVADPAQIAGLSHYSSDPSASSMDVALAQSFPAVSGAVEEVLALRPDVVVAGTFLPPATANALERTGIRLVRLPTAATIEQSRAQVMELAQLVGHADRGRALVERIDVALARAAPPPGTAPVPAVVWQSGGIVPGDDTLIADVLRHAGFSNFSATRGFRQADMLPLERMLADPPRVILAAGDPRANDDRLLSHPALDALTDTRRLAFEPALLWCGGPTIVRAANRLAAVRRAL